MQFQKVTRLRKVTGNDEFAHLKTLVYAVRNLPSAQTAIPELTPEEIEKFFPFLGWFPHQVAKQTMHRTTQLAKPEIGSFSDGF